MPRVIPQYERQNKLPASTGMPTRSSSVSSGSFGRNSLSASQQIAGINANLGRARLAANNQIAQAGFSMGRQALAGHKGVSEKLNKSMDRLSSNLLKQVELMAQREAVAWSAEQQIKLNEWATSYLNDKETGIYTRKGKDALGSSAQVSKDYREQIERMAEEAPSKAAQEAFKRRAGMLYQQDARRVARYESKERMEYEVASVKGALASTMRRLSSEYGEEPVAIERHFQELMGEDIKRLAVMTGAPEHVLEAEAKSKLYGEVILNNIAAGATGRARGMMKRWGEQVDPKVRKTVTAALRAKDQSILADRKVQDFDMRMARDEITLSQALEEANGIADIEVRKLVKSGIKASAWTRSVERRERKEQMLLAGYTGIDKLETLHERYIYAHTRPRRTKLEIEVADKIMSRYNAHAREKGLHMATNPKSFLAAVDAMVHGEIKTEQQLRAFRPDIAEPQLKRLATELTKAQRPLAKMRELYILASGSDKIKDAEDFYKFQRWMRSSAATTNRGQEPEYNQAMADLWFMQGEVSMPGSWYPGLGPNKDFREALKSPNWYPRILDDNDKDAKRSPYVLTKSRAAAIPRQLSPENWQGWLKKAGNGGEELAVKMYWKSYLMTLTGPRRRK